MKNKDCIVILILFIFLLIAALISLSVGEISIPVKEVFKGLVGNSSEYFNNVMATIRIPRVLIGGVVGATLSISGLLTSMAMRNSLADSGILGIQSGATVGALITLLVIPSLAIMLPIFSFAGGLIAFALLIVATMRSNFQPSKVVIVGIAINSIATSAIGIVTILNADKIKNALNWLNGSLAAITQGEMKIILIYSIVVLIVVFILMPIIKILRLEDDSIINIGYNPKYLRLGISLLAVLLASISVAFVGIISFIGIIAPQIAKRIVGPDVKIRMITSILIGSLLIIITDVAQRVIFSPVEIPVGILIGLIGAPMFIILAGSESRVNNQ